MRKSKFGRSISTKITLMTLTATIIAISILFSIVYNNFKTLNNNTLDIISEEVSQISHEYYENYIDSISYSVNTYIENVNRELKILRQLTADIIYENQIETSIEDKLKFNGEWYQNENNNDLAVFIQGYLLDKEGKIKDKPLELLEKTKFLNAILPSFSKYGVEKIQIYFQGGKESEIVRMSPWSDIGNDVFSVYPELNTVPIWDTFNPGLIEDWEKEKQIKGELEFDYGRVSQPVQDGVTGEIVLTYTQPIFDSKTDKVEGVVSTDVSISKIVSEVKRVKLGKRGFAFLMQSNGNVFALSESGADTLGIGSVEDNTINNDKGFSVLERHLSDSKYASIRELFPKFLKKNNKLRINVEGEGYTIFKKPINVYRSWNPDESFFDEYWYVAFVIPEKELYSAYLKTESEASYQMTKIVNKLIFYGIAVVFLLLIAIALYNKKITRGLKELVKATNEIKERKYDVDFRVKSNDEIGQLSSAFLGMASEINLNFKTMKEQNEKLKEEIEKVKKRDKKINYLENFDVATNLPNKTALLNYLNENKIQSDSNITLVVIGIDEFRKINEGYGHVVGDELINKVAERLKKLTYSKLLFKLKGDEFGLILKNDEFDDLVDFIEDLREELTKPYEIKNRKIAITMSIGVSSSPNDTEKLLDLYKFALIAMSHTKEINKGGYEFYSKNMNMRARKRLEMISALDQAISEEKFSLAYQPIVDLESEDWKGLEVLIRWEEPELGFISPEEFIPLAEETKKIIYIGKWILAKALEDLKKLHDLGYFLNLNVNVSVVQLVESSFVDEVVAIVKSSKISPAFIHLEVTESSFIEDKNAVKKILDELKEYGFSILIDDFGTGYSSLSYLKDLPISKLKIDKGFVIDLNIKENQEIVNTIIGLAQNLKFGIIAEGIETKGQKDYLISKGCELGQGYYYSKPVKIEDIEKMLRK